MDYPAKLIAAGVKNLKEFGYPHVNDSNILTDLIYSALFKRMLEDNRGHSTAVDKAIGVVLSRIAKAS